MIYYLVTRRHAYTMGAFLESWGSELVQRIRIVPYDYVFAGNRLPTRDASYIFSDLDRLSATERASLGGIHDQLVERCNAAKVLNDPRHSLLRLDALRTLHENGINDFNAFRVSDEIVPARFPAFVRREIGFETDELPLLNGRAEYEDALDMLTDQGVSPAEMLIVEFCDTKDESGLYRKYGAFIVGDKIVPRHLFFSRNWMVKLADLSQPEMLREERAYLDENPHEDLLRHVARLLGISYGRIDYSLFEGRPQVWEINSNPMIASVISSAIPERQATNLQFVDALVSAFDALEAGDVRTDP